MPLDHYIPASYLGLFSADKSRIKVRERKLAVYNFNSNTFFQSRAENLCAINNYYDQDVDKLWYYEGDIPSALDSLIHKTIDLKQWLTTLVPFVVSLLVRNPEFEDRFQERIHNLGATQNFSDYSRLFEFQRLLAPILAGDWKVLEVSGAGQAILSDLGFIPFTDGPSNINGVAISISTRHVLIIVPKRQKVVGIFDGNTWRPFLEYSKMVPGNLHSYNKSVADFARKFILGPTKESLVDYIDRPKYYEPPKIDYCKMDFISGPLSIPHEFTYHRIVSFIESEHKIIEDGPVELDFIKINKENIPMVFLPTNVPRFPSSVSIQGNAIFVDLYDVPGFPNTM